MDYKAAITKVLVTLVFLLMAGNMLIDKDSIGKITLADLENIFANSVNDTSKSGFSGSPALEQETAEVQVEEPFLKLLILLMNGMQY